jgi:hypothetical protein
MGNLTPELARHHEEIRELAKDYGLDFYETIFEVVDAEELNMIASYGGFPTRYPHWRFGMEYEQLSKGYQYGLSKIYELVINNDPCYAYLMRSNSSDGPEARDGARLRPLRLLQEQLLVQQDRSQDDGHDGEPRHARSVRYMDRHGVGLVVEGFIDAVQFAREPDRPAQPVHRA